MTQLQRTEVGQPSVSDIWTPLVQRLLPMLSSQVPDWAVLKNHARLPVVTGDIDLCIPRCRWDAFVDAYLAALATTGSYAVVICDHYIGARFTFAVPLDGPIDRALQIDLMDGICWKGTRLLSATEMLVNCVWDERGFRRVTTGLEAAVQLTCNALGHAGALRPDVVRAKGIRKKALANIDLFHDAMLAMHGRAGRWAAQRFVDDRWWCPVGLLLTFRRMLMATRHPFARSITFMRRKARAHYRGFPRHVPAARSAWLRQVSRGHRLHVVGSTAARVDPNIVS
jgi:hypothetical protein